MGGLGPGGDGLNYPRPGCGQPTHICS
jgi:hypothetical protein